MATEKRKTPKAFRLSDEGEGLLLALSQKLGVNQTGIVEMSLRRMAEQERVEGNTYSTATNPPEKATSGAKKA